MIYDVSERCAFLNHFIQAKAVNIRCFINEVHGRRDAVTDNCVCDHTGSQFKLISRIKRIVNPIGNTFSLHVLIEILLGIFYVL